MLAEWGQFWQGKSQFSSFIHSFFYQQTRPLQTPAQCEDGDTVIWTFRYPSGVNSAMIITVQNAQVVKLYWRLLPRAFDSAQSDSLESVSQSQAPVSAVVQASAIALAAGSLMYLVVRSDGARRPVHARGKLLAALKTAVENESSCSRPSLSPTVSSDSVIAASSDCGALMTSDILSVWSD